MQILQLIISGTKVDLFKDEAVTITDSIKNAKDLAKVFTTFSQQFSLPATKTNNKLFKHYYNWDIDNGFDARIRVDAIIQLNGVDYKIGKVKLNSVSLKNNKPNDYKVVFYGNTADLKSILGEDKLSDLEFVEVKKTGNVNATTTGSLEVASAGSDFLTTASEGDRVGNNTTGQYTSISSVVDNNTLNLADSSFSFTNGDAYTIYLSPIYNEASVKSKIGLQTSSEKNSLVTPLISHTRRLIYDAGSTSANTETLVNLCFNAAGTDKGIEYTDLKFAIRINEIIKAIENTYTIAKGHATAIDFTTDFFNNTNLDYYNLYMWLHRKSGAVVTSTSVSTYTFTLSSFTGGATSSGVDPYETGYTANGNQVYIQPETLTAFEIEADPSGTNTAVYTIHVIRNGTEIYTETASSATTTINITHADLGFSSVNDAKGVYQIKISADASVSMTYVKFVCSGSYFECDYYDNCTTATFTNAVATSGAFVSPAVPTFDVADQMPDMKVIDFVTGLMKMFNLIAFMNSEDKIEIRTLDNASSDSYYNLSSINTWDITEYIDVEKSEVNVALPYKELVFSYDDLKTFQALKHEQLFNQAWGADAWSTSTRIDGEAYKVIVPFSHFKYERLIDASTNNPTDIMYGWSVNESQSAYKGKPLLFYPLRQAVSVTDMSFLNEDGTDEAISIYNVPSNSRYLNNSSGEQNINFGAMNNEYDVPVASFSGTLVANYYYNYISNVFNPKTRIVKYTAYLPSKVLLNYQLNDVIIVAGKEYRINSIKSNLLNNKTELELITKP